MLKIIMLYLCKKIKSYVTPNFVIMGGLVWDQTAYSGSSNSSFVQIQIKLYLLTGNGKVVPVLN
jgi:hypothetical protein